MRIQGIPGSKQAASSGRLTPPRSAPPRSARRGRGPARDRRPSASPAQVSGVEPNAFDRRIAISTDTPVRSFTSSETVLYSRIARANWT